MVLPHCNFFLQDIFRLQSLRSLFASAFPQSCYPWYKEVVHLHKGTFHTTLCLQQSGIQPQAGMDILTSNSTGQLEYNSNIILEYNQMQLYQPNNFSLRPYTVLL